jgi:hypothetical protein
MCFCFSDLIFYPYFCIDNLYYFCWKSSFFYAIYKNDGRIKKYLSDHSFFLCLQISLELEKVYKKIVIYYYISGYHFFFTLFSMILFFLYIFVLSLFPNLYYFFVQIAFFFFSFFFFLF